MSELFEVVKQAFGEMEWAYEEVPGVEVVKLGFEAYHTKVELHAQVFAEQGVVSVVSQLPLLKRDERVMRVVAELLVRVNRDLTLGGFEMDWPHGQVLFRISNVFVAGAYQSDVIASMVHATVSETDRVTPFVDVVQRMNPGELLVLDVGTLLERKDLLPVVESDEEDDD